MKYKFLEFSINTKIATITLNRAEKHNALNGDFVTELKKAFTTAINSDKVKIILLKANGTSFCAGADLKYLQEISLNSLELNLKDSNSLMELFRLIYECQKITIAQVEGNAIAGGCGLVTLCDFSFGVKTALFGYTEVKLGFVPAIVSWFLVEKIGKTKAKELLLTGNLIGADEAKQIGLLNFSENPENINRSVNSFIDYLIKQTSQNSIEVTKELLNKINNLTFNDALNLSVTVNAKTRQHPDFKKGVNSFLTKIPTEW